MEQRADWATWRWWLAAVVLVGAGLRVAQYWADVPFWHDEATLVFNIVEKDRAALLGPLDAYPAAPQAAPPMFLLAERWVYERFGESRLALRALPLACGVLALGVFALLARGLLAPATAVFATLLFALSDHLIWHAVEVKQYSGDVLAACVLLVVALRPRGEAGTDLREAIGWRGYALATVAASLLLWFSHATVFVLAGLGLARAWEVLRGGRSGRGRELAGWLMWTAVPVAAFALVYLLSIRVQQAPFLYEYWVNNGKMMDWSRWWMLPVWVVGNAWRLVDYPFELASAVLAPLVAVGGWVIGRKRRGAMLLALAGPAGLVLVTGLAQVYPFGGHRLTLFMAPHLLLLAGLGLEHLWDRPWRQAESARKGIVVACIVALLAPAAMATKGLFEPRRRSVTSLDALRAAVQQQAPQR